MTDTYIKCAFNKAQQMVKSDLEDQAGFSYDMYRRSFKIRRDFERAAFWLEAYNDTKEAIWIQETRFN